MRSIHAMNSSYTSITKVFLVLLCVTVALIGPAGAQPGGRLVVMRAPNFGWNLALNLNIDGRTAANLVQGRRYDHFLPAGRHVLIVSAVPNYSSSQPTATVLNVQPGQTYVFTAVWHNSDQVVLAPSALSPGQAY
jgi:hypothetical protein